MFLSDVDPIDLATLGRSFLSFVELRYLEMAEGERLQDDRFADDREQALASFRRFLDDEPECEHAVRRGVIYMLNVDRAAFEQLLRTTDFPQARWNPDDAHRFLVDLWTHVWGDWKVPDFDDLEIDLEP